MTVTQQAWTHRSAAARFGGASRWVEHDGPVHLVDYGGDSDNVTFLLLHGFGGSYLDWSALAPFLRQQGRVHALDLPAFGLSPSADRSGSISDDAELVIELIRRELGGPVVVLGNSRGGMVAAFVAARAPELVRGLALMAPALPAPGILPEASVLLRFGPAGLPLLGQSFVRLGRSRASADLMVEHFLQYCFADQRRIPADYRLALRELLAYRKELTDTDRPVANAAFSTLRNVYWHRPYDALLSNLDVPVLHVHGAQDRLVPVRAAHRARSRYAGWDVCLLDGVGHTPQLEVPEIVNTLVAEWLDRRVL